MDIATGDKGVFGFGPFLLDRLRRRLTLDGEVVKLPPTQFDTLLYLVQNPGRVVEKDELLAAVWGGRIIEEGNLSQAIYLLRRALGRGEGGEGYIVTAPGRGYRFSAEVQRIFEPEAVLRTKIPLEQASSDNAINAVLTPAVTAAEKRRPGLLFLVALGAALLIIAVLGATVLRRSELLKPEPASAPSEAAFHPPAHSVAVLAFTNMSGDPQQEYFSDGMSEELIDALGRLGTLRVSARVSSFSFKDKSVNIAEIARRLNVGAILEGSVRRDGIRVRVTTQLVDAQTGFQLWSQHYDRNRSDILSLQSEIAESVAASLRVTFDAHDKPRLAAGGTTNPDALDAYLRGMNFIYGTADAGNRKAIEAMNEALALDPQFARAYVARAFALSDIFEFGSLPDVVSARHMIDGALADVDRAIAIAPELASAHQARAKILLDRSLDFTNATAEYEKARALAPDAHSIDMEFGLVQVYMGRSSEGVSAAERAVSFDPVNPVEQLRMAEVYFFVRRYNDALAAIKHSQQIGQIGFTRGMALTGLIKLMTGDAAAAIAACRANRSLIESVCSAAAFHALGKQPEAAEILSKVQSMAGANAAFNYAEIYARWGQVSTALQWLNRAFLMHSPALIIMKVDPFLDSVRDQPQFKELERRLNFPP